MTSTAAPSSALEATLRWASDHYGTQKVTIVNRVMLDGGVSGATVERVSLRVDPADSDQASQVAVVIKHTRRQEIDALTLLAELAEPAIPQLLASGHDGNSDWMVIPWFPNAPVGLLTEVPAAVGTLMARVHTRFLARPDEWPGTLERIDSRFIHHALTDFLPDSLVALAPSSAGDQFRTRATAQAEQLLTDHVFLELVETFPATVLHGDLYGLNVLREPSGAVMVIDWNTARVGPGMFDIAMSAASESSPLLEAYLTERAKLGHGQQAFGVELNWAFTLINTMFAGVVAQRGSIHDAHSMLDLARATHARLTR